MLFGHEALPVFCNDPSLLVELMSLLCVSDLLSRSINWKHRLYNVIENR